MITSDKKPTVGVFSLCGCGGCTEQILSCDSDLFLLCDQVSIVYWPYLGLSEEPKSLDIAIVEGGVCNESQKEALEQIRNISDFVIATGLCACTSSTFCDDATKDSSDSISKLKPISDFVDVDFFVRGCPIDTHNFIDILQSCIYGRNTFETTATLCGSCKMNEKGCLFGRGKMCAGLVTTSGCGALCTSLNRPCFGCHGTSPNANFDTLRSVVSHSIDDSEQEKYYSEFLKTCDASCFFADEANAESIDVLTYFASRKSGRYSQQKTIECLTQYEASHNVHVDRDSQLLREVLVNAESARNLLTDLFVDLFSESKTGSSFVDCLYSPDEMTKNFLATRGVFSKILREIGGREVHPITPVVGGFSVTLSRETVKSMSEALVSVMDFCLGCVDMANQKHDSFEVGAETPTLDHVMLNWDDLSDPARFASAKVALRPPVSDKTMECVAMAVSVVDSVQRSIAALGEVLKLD